MGEHGEAGENSGSLSEEREVEVDLNGGRGGERRYFQTSASTSSPGSNVKTHPWLSVYHIPDFYLWRNLQSTML